MQAVRNGSGVEEREVVPRRINRRKKWFRGGFTFLVILAVAFMCGSYVSTHYYTLLQIYGNSMEDTLQAGDVVTCRKNAEVAQGDIVAFRRDDALMIRRVIAVAGDRISIPEDGKVYVNDNPIDEPYLLVNGTDGGDETYPMIVPEGQVFVAGDNRVVSIDSRNSDVGTISLTEIIGVAEIRVWPIHRIGQL
jgi:signal peptidase I